MVPGGPKRGSVNLDLTCFFITIFRPLCVLVGEREGGGGSAAREVQEVNPPLRPLMIDPPFPYVDVTI